MTPVAKTIRLDGFLGSDLGQVVAIAGQLEAAGYDGGFTAEGPHEPFLALALAAEHTRALTLMTNIVVGFARNPMDLAQAANDLQRAARGRFILGVGSQIRPHIEKRFSMPWSRPVARMRELVLALKAIQASWQDATPLAFRGEFYRHTLMTPFFSPGPNPYGPPPVFVAALGPRMTEVAAEVGDGLLVHPFHSGEFVANHCVPAVELGLGTAGRARDAFTLAATTIVATGSTDEELSEADAGVRGLLAFYGSTPAYRVVLDTHGWGPLQEELNHLSKQGRWADMAMLIPDTVTEALVVRGRPQDIAGLVAERYRGHVDRVSLSMPYRVSSDTMAAVIAGFRSRAATN